jgi:hypothetical protein
LKYQIKFYNSPLGVGGKTIAMSVSAPAKDVSSIVYKPKLNFAQLINMSFGFFGIQFGFALQNANVSRIFQTLVLQLIKYLFYGLLHLSQVY